MIHLTKYLHNLYKKQNARNINKKMKKRGQVTLFIIIAIIVVALVLFLVFYFKPEIFKSQTEAKEIIEKQVKVNSIVEKAT